MRTENVLERAGELGTQLLMQYLMRQKKASDIAFELTQAGFKAKTPNVQILLNRYESLYARKPAEIHKLLTPRQTARIVKKISDSVKKDIAVDPVGLIQRNIIELERLKENTFGDIRSLGAIIDLQSKLANQLHKIQPTAKSYDLDNLLRKSDDITEFIIVVSRDFPGLKKRYLEYIDSLYMD